MITEDTHQGGDTESGQEPSREALYERFGIGEDEDVEIIDTDSDTDSDEEPSTDVDTDEDADTESDTDTETVEDDEEEEAESEVETEDDGETAEEVEEEDEVETEDPEVEAKKWLGKVPDSEWSKIPPVSKDRIKFLRKTVQQSRKQLEEAETEKPFATYGRKIVEFADKAQIADEDLAGWLRVGAVVNKGGQEAISALLDVAKNLGWQPPTEASHTPEQPADSDDGSLPAWLQKRVDDFEITEEVAQDIYKRMKPAQKPTPSPQERPPAPAPPGNDIHRAVEEGRRQVNALMGEAAKKYGSRWPKIQKLVEAEMLKERGADPRAWGPLFKKSLEVVELRRKRTKKRVSTRETSVPASGADTPASSRESNLSPRERIYKQYAKGS